MLLSIIVITIVLLYGLLARLQGRNEKDKCGRWALFLSSLFPVIGLLMYLSTSDNLVEVPIVNRRLYLVYAIMGIVLWSIYVFL